MFKLDWNLNLDLDWRLMFVIKFLDTRNKAEGCFSNVSAHVKISDNFIY